MPALSDFYRAHQAQRHRFEILAFHDASVASLEDLDAGLEPLVRRLWDGKPLPYPVLLDPSGETLRRYGVDEYPTHILLDPRGRVVAAGNEALLPELLARLDGILGRER